jgi:hypothetical protein
MEGDVEACMEAHVTYPAASFPGDDNVLCTCVACPSLRHLSLLVRFLRSMTIELLPEQLPSVRSRMAWGVFEELVEACVEAGVTLRCAIAW